VPLRLPSPAAQASDRIEIGSDDRIGQASEVSVILLHQVVHLISLPSYRPVAPALSIVGFNLNTAMPGRRETAIWSGTWRRSGIDTSTFRLQAFRATSPGRTASAENHAWIEYVHSR